MCCLECRKTEPLNAIPSLTSMVEWCYYFSFIFLVLKILNQYLVYGVVMMKKIMVKFFIMLFIFFSLCGCSSSPSDSLSPSEKTIEGYSFDKYKVEIFPLSEKAKINFSSNPYWKLYKTKITKDYKNRNVDFGGYYIAIIINCGVICRVGAMVDIRYGRIYSLPLGDGMGYAECYSNRNVVDDEGIHYKPNSRLFITSSCSETEIKNSKNNKQHKVYFINVWDEAKKKFILEKKIEQSLIVEREV
ncbi:hypothetical protein ASZ90_005650 [hydrocarbon metagenome]|uniref:Uncharacterized protein n=1 Tax=hydrocarbon metagenome TaxID=938273 RepID=A0A0W8FUI2_9ZZZZ